MNKVLLVVLVLTQAGCVVMSKKTYKARLAAAGLIGYSLRDCHQSL